MKKSTKWVLALVMIAAAALAGLYLWKCAGTAQKGAEKQGFHGVRGAFEGFSYEEYSADGKNGYVVKAKEAFIRDQKFLRVFRFSGKRENVLQTAEVTVIRDRAPAATATSAKGSYFPATGSVRLEEGVTIKIGGLTVFSPVAFFKREGTLELPGEYRFFAAGGRSSTGKSFKGTPEELLKLHAKK